MPYTLTDDQIQELWDRYGAGETAASLARRFHKTSASMSQRIPNSGGTGRTCLGAGPPT